MPKKPDPLAPRKVAAKKIAGPVLPGESTREARVRLNGKSPDRNKKPRKTYKFGEIMENPITPETRQRKNVPICGAKRTGRSHTGPGICCQIAGWGTNHVGYGSCRMHGGNLPGPSQHANNERMIEEATKTLRMYGEPIDKDPQEALLDLVHRTSGHVAWLGDFIAAMDDPATLRQVTESGVSPSVWIKMYQDERKLLVDISKAAVAAGVAEREVRLKEEQGRLLAAVIQAILTDAEFDLSPVQRVIAPKIVRRHLLSLEPASLTPDTLQRIAEGEVIDV